MREALGADADDDPVGRERRRAAARVSGTCNEPELAPTSPSTCSGIRFIAGEPMKPATNTLAGSVNSSRGVCALLQQAVLQHGDAVAHRHRLDLVVGDVDRGDAEPALQRGDLGAGLHAQLGVEVRQRLVHQEHLRLAHDRPAHRHPLALTARELGRLAVEVVVEVEERGRLAHASVRSPAFGTRLILRWKPMFSATVMCGYSA